MNFLIKGLAAICVTSAVVYLLLGRGPDETPQENHVLVLELPVPGSDSFATQDRDTGAAGLPATDTTSESAVVAPPADEPVNEPTTTSDATAMDASAADKDEEDPWQEYEVAPGDTLAKIFSQLEIDDATLPLVLAAGTEAKNLASIKPGQLIRIRLGQNGQLEELVHEQSSVSSLRILSNGAGFDASVEEKPKEMRVESTTAIINSSLFADGREAGLSSKTIMEMARLFNWDIDFALDLQQGDKFSVIYEAHYVEGEKYRDGDILAAEFINGGKNHRAIRYQDPGGTLDYYAPDGTSKKKAFIKTPVDFTRISSGFTRNRWHPILKRWRAHKGVDYSAPEGTPVKAAGNGRVTFIGRQQGYGKVIILQHGDHYTTVYGHLSGYAKGLKNGSEVKQGKVIGYVGHTGLATGPHLHYEFRVDGTHVDPLSAKLPTAMPLPKKYMADFKRHAETLVQQLDLLAAPRVAKRG